MTQLTHADLMTLETYSKERDAFRAKVLEHKKNRRVKLGDNATLYFEDKLTIQYQIQEMLRIEKIFEQDAIDEELSVYNPLIPNGQNLKATFMIEYTDIAERRLALEKLIGIEDAVWLQVTGFEKVMAIADEDMERDNAEKTSAVHFMRFEFTPEMTSAACSGADINIGSDHKNLTIAYSISAKIKKSLVSDFEC
ncbi:Hypothetical protein in Rubrerythrin cluster [hydrothermal vent metagenome]|uniref:DUF3501 domain-containing protein n=1 Tax=hydrothermal vent metagenome TaxID=652676 RepID=A0A3B0ZM90_9ZZZZ